MGAELISAIAVWPKDVTLDFEAGTEAAKNIQPSDVSEYILDMIGWDAEVDPVEELQKYMSAYVGELQDLMDSHGAVTYEVRGFNILVVADMTWGDSPDGFDAICICADTEAISKALGLVDP